MSFPPPISNSLFPCVNEYNQPIFKERKKFEYLKKKDAYGNFSKWFSILIQLIKQTLVDTNARHVKAVASTWVTRRDEVFDRRPRYGAVRSDTGCIPQIFEMTGSTMKSNSNLMILNSLMIICYPVLFL